MAGEISPKNSRFEPMNPDATFRPQRAKRFSLSTGERAGVRCSLNCFPQVLMEGGRKGCRYRFVFFVVLRS